MYLNIAVFYSLGFKKFSKKKLNNANFLTKLSLGVNSIFLGHKNRVV